MMPISGVSTGAVQPLTAAEKTPGAPQVRKEETQGQPLKPVMDEYVPEEPQEPSGRYWMGKDEAGPESSLMTGRRWKTRPMQRRLSRRMEGRRVRRRAAKKGSAGAAAPIKWTARSKN